MVQSSAYVGHLNEVKTAKREFKILNVHLNIILKDTFGFRRHENSACAEV